MGITIKAFLLFFIFISTLALVNTASAGITVIDAEATYEANLSSVSVPIEPISVKSIFTFNEGALLEQVLFRVRIPTQPIPIKEIFIINEDAAFDTSLFAVSIPTERSPIKKIFVHLEDAKAYEDLIFPIKLMNDTTSPIITNITVTNITYNSAMVKWDTNEIADSLVKYGEVSGNYTEIERNPLFVRNHTIALAKLSSGTKYYFVVNSTDRSGNSAESLECSFTTGSEWIEKAGHPPVAVLKYKPYCPVVNQTITFNASSSYDPDDPSGYYYNITSYDWDFGDGNTTTGKIVNHSYSSAGNYTINLTVTDNEGLTNSTTKVIHVGISSSQWIGITSQGKVVSFNVIETKVCYFNTSWNFTSGNFTNRVVANGSFRISPIDIVGNEFEWQYEHNTSIWIYGKFISPNYASGFFRKFHRSHWDTGNITWNATKVNELPMANFIFSPSQPIVNQLITLDASSTFDPDGYIASYKWDFGEGTNGTGEIVEHSYSSAGNYTVNLTVTDDSNSENYTSLTIPVRPGLSKPINMDAVEVVYPLDPAAKDKLFNNGFLVLKDHEHGNISDCYWDLFFREDVSVFITSDAMLHIFHVVHDDMLRDIEKQYLYNSTELLVQDMQRKSMQEYENISSNLTYVKEAARRNVVFFTVACKLLNDSYPVPSYAEENVTEYVQKILNHSAAEFYPGDDYTQYEPRGHYEGDPTLESYFRGMKWLSRRIFRIEDYKYPEDSHIEMIQAVMISEMLQESPTDMQLWGKVYNVTTLLVGTADSITPVMVQKAVSNVFPTNFTLSQLENATNIEKLRTEFKKTEYPESQIIPVPLEYPGQIPPKYVQFMGERYVPDSYVFQQDIYPYISDVTRLPKGLEVMATMLGSNRADQLLEEEKQTYPELGSQMNKLKTEFENYTADKWTKNVYCNWFYTLDPLLVEFNQSYPVFMQTEAWQDEKLNTALSSWTQLRHDYILYAKQTYVPAPWAAGYGYVEPIPEFYNRLASLCRKINTELSDEDVLLQKYQDHFSSLANELDKFEKYSQKIVNNQTLTIEEQGDIHCFGLWLLGFFSGGIKEEEPTLVADVCTNSFTGKVLHEGVGKFNPVIIIYEQPDGITLAGVGFVMSYYEFTEENFNRITDSEWKERAEKGTLPPRPFWANSFLYNVR